MYALDALPPAKLYVIVYGFLAYVTTLVTSAAPIAAISTERTSAVYPVSTGLCTLTGVLNLTCALYVGYAASL